MTAQFENRRVDASDVDAGRQIEIWDAQRYAPIDRGRVIGWYEGPSVLIRHANGTTKTWPMNLPWRVIPPEDPHAAARRYIALIRDMAPDAVLASRIDAFEASLPPSPTFDGSDT